MQCISCNKPNEMQDGKFSLARYTFQSEISFSVRYICRECCALAVAAWAIKTKIDNQEPPASPKPTGGPAASMPAIAA